VGSGLFGPPCGGGGGSPRRQQRNRGGTRSELAAGGLDDQNEGGPASTAGGPPVLEVRKSLQSALAVLAVALETLEKQRHQLPSGHGREADPQGSHGSHPGLGSADFEFQSRLVLPDLAVVLQSVGKSTTLHLPVLQFV
jgi:hypothetical protein